jgi:hypothetical protein
MKKLTVDSNTLRLFCNNKDPFANKAIFNFPTYIVPLFDYQYLKLDEKGKKGLSKSS